jgi:hypothetical protein
VPSNLPVSPKLRRHVVAEPRNLHRVFERVLPIRRPKLQAAEKLEEFGMEIGDADLERRRLTVGEELLLHLALDLGHELLDAAGVDAAVLNEVCQRLPCNLAPHRFETRQDHRARGVVDDQVNAGSLFEGSNVPALATDDPPLHLIRRQVDYRHRALDHVLRRDALDGHRDHSTSLFLGLLVGLVFDSLDHVRGVDPRLVLHRSQELGLGLLDGEAGDLFEPRALLCDRVLELLFPLDEAAVTLLNLRLQRRDALIALVELGGSLIELDLLFIESAGEA